MRKRFRYDPDLEAVVEIRDDNYFLEGKIHTISDDVGAGVNGLKHMPSGLHLDSKSRHRAETRARGLVEVGNETNFASPKAKLPGADAYVREVLDANAQLASNWNGTADLRRREREERR